MTEQQIGVNANAIRNLAARLERSGYPGDPHAEAEKIALNLLADGYRPVEKPPSLRGTWSTRAAREQALTATAEAVAAAKDRHPDRPRPQPAYQGVPIP